MGERIMKTKDTTDLVGKCLAIAPKFFAIVMVLCTLFLVVGEFLLPDERDAADRHVQAINSDWYRIMDDGQKVAIEIPCNLDVAWGETVTVGMILPTTVRNGESICFRPVWQDVWEVFTACAGTPRPCGRQWPHRQRR